MHFECSDKYFDKFSLNLNFVLKIKYFKSYVVEEFWIFILKNLVMSSITTAISKFTKVSNICAKLKQKNINPLNK